MSRVNVIIPTYKPDEKFLKLISRLEKQTVKPERIIVVNTEQKYYDRLIYGKSCDVHLYDGNTQSFDISYIDWEHPENNIWQVTDEFSVERTNGKYARPDIVLLVNGIPLVVIECKKSSVDVEEGVKQNVRNWQPDYIPQLFKFTQLAIAMNPESVKYGTAGTKQGHLFSNNIMTGIYDGTHITNTIGVMSDQFSIFNYHSIYGIHKFCSRREFITFLSRNSFAWHGTVKSSCTNLL